METITAVEPKPKKVHKPAQASTEPKPSQPETVLKAEYDRMIVAYELQLQQANLQTSLTRDKLVQAETKITVLEAAVTEQ